MQRISVGDLDNATAYVEETIRRELPLLDPGEREDFVSEGLAIVWQIACDVPEGESVRAAVARSLRSRLIDAWRASHPEYRRNWRAGTVTMIVATGLSSEYEDASVYGADDPQEIVEHRLAVEESQLALSVLRDQADLTDPRVVGRLLGVPSHRPLPPGRAANFWPTVEDERRIFSL